MHRTLEDDLKLYASLITQSFDALDSVPQCTERLRQAGFRFDDETDLVVGSAFLEAIKSVLIEIAWKENNDLKGSQINLAFKIDLLRISARLQQPSKRLLALLITVLDSLCRDNSTVEKDTREFLRPALTLLQSNWPTFLSWIPFQYLACLNATLGTSINLNGGV